MGQAWKTHAVPQITAMQARCEAPSTRGASQALLCAVLVAPYGASWGSRGSEVGGASAPVYEPQGCALSTTFLSVAMLHFNRELKSLSKHMGPHLLGHPIHRIHGQP